MPRAFSGQFYVICTPGLVVDFKLDGLANFSASISTVPTSSHYRGASCAFPIFSDIAKACLWAGATSYLAIGLLKANSVNRGSWWFPVHRVAEAHLRIYTPGYYFSNEGPKPTCGKRRRRAVARSEQYPGVNNIPKGPTCFHPEVCSTFVVEGNICWTSLIM